MVTNETRPYQGVRVKDPVKELLRRKRSLDQKNVRMEAFTDDQPPYSQASADVADGSVCADYKPLPPPASVGLQSTSTHWSSSDIALQDPSVQMATYIAAPSLAADRCMQTLCPSYTMLTYTHTPVLTNFQTIPVAPATSSISHTQVPETGLTIIPWAQPFTTLSTMCSPPGPPLVSSSAAIPAAPLRHMPLPLGPHLQMLNHQMDPDSSMTLNEDVEVKPPSPNLLDKLLEDQKEEGAVEDRDCPFCL
ncbi:POU domain class 2-associating factor 1 [Synchiropus splendidus]|uniref:POU domain class 2-associating factor 1 n=1 Tax=Synchiropus splendidus TaxID=270530 RepID=UPI00237D5C61|nr:POU domain class 2-associating factor 1 [Synchiropus splendidus]